MASSEATEILDALMRNMREIISTRTVIGEPIQSGETTILPLMKVSLGFGAGAGRGEETGSKGGGGGGVSITPIGFLVVDEHRAIMVTPKSSKWEWVAEAVPEILEKLNSFRKGGGGKESGKGTDPKKEGSRMESLRLQRNPNAI